MPTKRANDGSRWVQPPAALTAPGALGSITHLRACSKSGVSGLSRIRSRYWLGTLSIG